MKRVWLASLLLVAACATQTQEQKDKKTREEEISARISAKEHEDERETARRKSRSYKVRVTNNAETIRGCELLGAITRFQSVKRFQESVSLLDGNVGYIVATNEDGEMIGEAYLCEQPK